MAEVYAEQGDGKPRFRLLARNGEKILASQAYKAKASCMDSIASVVHNTPDAPVWEMSGE